MRHTRHQALALLSAILPACLEFEVSPKANQAPLASPAAVEQTALLGATVILDGSASHDPDGDDITFLWEQVEGSGDPVALVSARTPVASFVAPNRAQILFFRLTVNDGAVDGVPAVVQVTVRSPPNQAPVAAVAAATIAAQTGQTVVLDGNLSRDPDGDPLTYRWEQVEAGANRMVLTNAQAAVASFVAPDKALRLFFQLTVNDGRADSNPAIVQVDIVTPPNEPPLASAPGEIAAFVGEIVVMNGSASHDPDLDVLTYVWQQVPGSGDPVNLQNADSPVASFVAPDRGQRLFFRLIVNDGKVDSTPAVIRVDIFEHPNEPPVAKAAPERVVYLGERVFLDGSASSDPDGDVLAYRWVQIEGSGEPVNISDPDKPIANFIAPDTAQRLFFQLTVNDRVVDSVPAVVRVDVYDLPNEPPVAKATPERVVYFGQVVYMDGTASSDPDGDDLTYHWTQEEGSGDPVNVRDADQPIASFIAPDTAQRLFLRLVVNDGRVDSVPAIVKVDVTASPNAAPVAGIRDPDQLVGTNDTVILDGSASSDPDGDVLTYRWEQVSGTGDPIVLANATSPQASFVAPDIGQRLFFRLIVRDGRVDSAPALAKVLVNAQPIADAGAQKSVDNQTPILIVGQGIELDGGFIVSYLWSVDSGPACTTDPDACLSGRDSPAVTFTPPVKGDYLLSLVVNDGYVDSAPDTVLVRSLNRLPRATPGANPISVPNGSSISLSSDGSTDPDGDALVAYKWLVASLPAPSATATFAPVAANIAAPNVRLFGKGSYFLSLEVKDQDGAWSLPALLRVEATNNPPVADAGSDLAVPNGFDLTILGRGLDPDGDPLTFTWRLVDYPTGGLVNLSDPEQRSIRFTPILRTPVTNPADCQPSQCYRLELVVSDGTVASTPDEVAITSLNRRPVANAGPNIGGAVRRVTLDGIDSFDPDGDALSDYVWKQVEGSDVTGGVGSLSGQTVSFDPSQAGTYLFDLTVSDGQATSLPDRVRVDVSDTNRPPVLVLASTQVVAVEGTAFAGLDASSSVDPDNDGLIFVWSRRAGSPALFPPGLGGPTPSPLAPSFSQLLDQASDNLAVYDVYVTDGTLDSPRAAVTLYVAPGPGWVILSNAANASDGASPACGSYATPCAGLRRAIQVVDPDGNDLGNGRNIVVTSGQFESQHLSNPVVFPGGTRMIGGRDPVTFRRAGSTELRMVGASCCLNQLEAMRFQNTASNVLVENVTFRVPFSTWSANTAGIRCNGCQATLKDVEIAVSGVNPNGVPEADQVRGVEISGSAADLTLARAKVVASGSDFAFNYGIHLTLGAKLTLQDSVVKVTASLASNANSALRVESSTAAVIRSSLFVSGPVSAADAPSSHAFSSATGTFTILSSVLSNDSNTDSVGVLHGGGGTGTLFNNTILGGGGQGRGAGIRTSLPLSLMNNYVADFPFAVQLTSASAKSSLVYSNDLVASGAALAICDGVTETALAALNATAGTGCNATGEDWTGNKSDICPLVNRGDGDYHLVTGVPNPCQNTGVSASLAGVAPAFDLDAEARSDPYDIGADEAPP